MTCQCKVCLEYKEFNDRIGLLQIEHQDFFNRMYDKVTYLESVTAQLQGIIDGTWPGADEFIKRKRELHAARSIGK